MLEARFVPLQTWPVKKTINRQGSRFKSSWQQTLTLLEDELRRIRAKRIVIQVDLDASQIRNDGWPRSSANPRSPGVVLSFESPKGSLSFPCDRYDDWKDNVRAIGLSLEALRTVDRYGVTQSSEQYRGWTALPPPVEEDDPYSVLAKFADTTREAAMKFHETVYQRAVMKVHPDKGGNAADFMVVQKAIETIRAKRGEQRCPNTS